MEECKTEGGVVIKLLLTRELERESEGCYTEILSLLNPFPY